MNVAITLARKGTAWGVITLPHEAPMRDQLKNFHVLVADKAVRAKFDEIQVWSHGAGLLKKRVFSDSDGKRVRSLDELNELDKKHKIGVHNPKNQPKVLSVIGAAATLAASGRATEKVSTTQVAETSQTAEELLSFEPAVTEASVAGASLLDEPPASQKPLTAAQKKAKAAADKKAADAAKKQKADATKKAKADAKKKPKDLLS